MDAFVFLHFALFRFARCCRTRFCSHEGFDPDQPAALKLLVGQNGGTVDWSIL